jgi:hypothetical protein
VAEALAEGAVAGRATSAFNLKIPQLGENQSGRSTEEVTEEMKI